MIAVAAPRGVDAGNHFIAKGASNGTSGASLSPMYDPMRRIVKIVETTGGTVTSTKQFVWAGDQLCEERDATGAVTRRFFSNGQQIGGADYYYTRDHLGSVREMTDGSGNVVAALSYDPFGRPTKLQGSSPEPSFGYAGMYLHERSGLNLAVNRSYSASLGRFVSRDPIEDPMFNSAVRPEGSFEPNLTALGLVRQSALSKVPTAVSQTWDQSSKLRLAGIQGLGQWNSYSYAANDPIGMVDPSGLSPTLCPNVPPDPCEANPKLCACILLCRLEAKRGIPVDVCLPNCMNKF